VGWPHPARRARPPAARGQRGLGGLAALSGAARSV